MVVPGDGDVDSGDVGSVEFTFEAALEEESFIVGISSE